MPIKTKRISADEAMASRKDHVRETDRGMAVVKAARGPASWDKEARSARFVMTAQTVDRYGDIVVTEGIDTVEFEKNPVAPFCHNTRSWPVGTWGNLEKVLKGRPPRMEGDLMLLPAGGPCPEIEQLEWMLANGGIRACSIGFVPDWDDAEMILDEEGKWSGGIRWNRSELIECSPCVVPANPQAIAKMAAGNMRMAKELIEDVLDNWARSPEGVLMPRKDFEEAYRSVVERMPPAGTLPVTDDEIAAADIRSVEFEVAKLVPAIDGTTVAVSGERNLLLKAVDGKWKCQGEPKAGDKSTARVECKVVDDKFVYAKATQADATYDDGEWRDFPASEGRQNDIGATDEGITVDPGNGAGSVVKDCEIKLKADTSEVEASISKVSGLLDGLAEKIAKVFGRKAPESQAERVEPVMAIEPTKEEVEAAKAKAAETLARLRAKAAA